MQYIEKPKDCTILECVEKQLENDINRCQKLRWIKTSHIGKMKAANLRLTC